MSLSPDQKIQPEKITKPFQLLAAWLVGLILVNASLLTSACLIKDPAWVAPMLVIAAIVNVPTFLIAIFLLQTKFRPQMQEDPFYSKYLENQNTKGPQTNAADELSRVRLQISDSQKQTLEIIKGAQDQIESLKNEIVMISESIGHGADSEKRISRLESLLRESAKNIEAVERKTDWSIFEVALNDLLPEFPKIKNALISNGITISEYFGTKSIDAEIPETFVLSVGLGVPIDEFKKLISLLRPFGLAAVNLNRDEADQMRIYVGSYLYSKIQVTPLAKVDGVISKAKRTEDLLGQISSFSFKDYIGKKEFLKG